MKFMTALALGPMPADINPIDKLMIIGGDRNVHIQSDCGTVYCYKIYMIPWLNVLSNVNSIIL